MPSATANSDKRQRIVETAYGLFKRDGFHAVGIDRIIAEADVAKMTMYRHFPGKDGLILAVLDWRAERFERQLLQLSEGVGSSQRKIEALFDWYARWFRSDEFYGCLFAHAIAEYGTPSHPVFMAAAQQKLRMRVCLLDLLQGAGFGARAATLATTMLMLIEGATLLAQIGEGETAIRDAKLAAFELMGEEAAAA